MNNEQLKANYKANKKKYKAAFSRLSKLKGSQVDEIINEQHNEVFACTDCLRCGNCCRTTGPRFTRADISRISKYKNVSEQDFIDTYLRVDEDNDFVLQSVPCPFLNLNDNKCSIYDFRPKACAEYPHTDMGGQLKIQQLTIKNASICPAVAEILDKLSNP